MQEFGWFLRWWISRWWVWASGISCMVVVILSVAASDHDKNQRIAASTSRPPIGTVQSTARTYPGVNRLDCDAIRGTDYYSAQEREWYLANCLNPGSPTPTPGIVAGILDSLDRTNDLTLGLACQLAFADDGQTNCDHNSLVLYEGALSDLDRMCGENVRTIAMLVQRAHDGLQGTNKQHQNIQLMTVVVLGGAGMTDVNCDAVFRNLVEFNGGTW
jgi:hypothetical protein